MALKLAAVHEAGHAVVHVVLGGALRRVTIDPNTLTGLTSTRTTGELTAALDRNEFHPSGFVYATVAASGYVAEAKAARLAGVSEPSAKANAGDLRNIAHVARLAPSLREFAEVRAADLLDCRHVWRAVEVLAHRLLVHGEIEGDTAEVVIRQALAGDAI